MARSRDKGPSERNEMFLLLNTFLHATDPICIRHPVFKFIAFALFLLSFVTGMDFSCTRNLAVSESSNSFFNFQSKSTGLLVTCLSLFDSTTGVARSTCYSCLHSIIKHQFFEMVDM